MCRQFDSDRWQEDRSLSGLFFHICSWQGTYINADRCIMGVCESCWQVLYKLDSVRWMETLFLSVQENKSPDKPRAFVGHLSCAIYVLFEKFLILFLLNRYSSDLPVLRRSSALREILFHTAASPIAFFAILRVSRASWRMRCVPSYTISSTSPFCDS